MRAILSFDIEEWFHPEVFNGVISPDSWEMLPSRVEENVDIILEILERHNVVATFFILGWVAERHPEMVKRIHRAGHEVASHGYAHRMITQMTPEEFETDLVRALQILRNLVDAPVAGYRAPTFSITPHTLWALPILAKHGIQYDSSVFPIHHDRYGYPDAPRKPYIIYQENEKQIQEFPMPTVQIGKIRLPVGGGGYFRLYPLSLTNFLLKRAESQKITIIFYAHPWEFDLHLPSVALPLLSRIRHYSGIGKMKERLEQLLNRYEFTSFTLFHSRV